MRTPCRFPLAFPLVVAAAILAPVRPAGAQGLEPPPAPGLEVPLETPPEQPEAVPSAAATDAEAEPPEKAPPAEVDEIPPPPAWVNEAMATPPPRRQGRVRAQEPRLPLPDLAPVLPAGTMQGALGLLRVFSAKALAPSTLSLQLSGAFSAGEDVVVSGDENTRLSGSFSAAYGVSPGLELYASIAGASNRNRRVCENGRCESEEGRVDPEVIRAFGDLGFGAKASRALSRGADVAAYASVRLMAAADGVFLDWSATSLAFGGLATWDLSSHRDWPLRLHVNLGYFVDNSSKLTSFDGVGQPSRLVAAYAYGIGRSRFQTAAALEIVPQRLSPGFALSPFIEYHLEVVTGQSDPAFADFATPQCFSSGRPCQENRDQQWLTAGLRAALGESWWALVGFDIGVQSVGFPFGPPIAPLTFVFQTGRPFDLGARPRPSPVSPLPPAPAPADEAPEDGVIAGRVVNDDDGPPVPLAIVAVEGRAHARVATDEDGTFTTHDLEPGAYVLRISAPGFEPRAVEAKVGESMVTEVEVALSRLVQARVRGRVVDGGGRGLQAIIRFTGSSERVAQSQASGAFEIDLVPGVYVARVEAEEHLTKERRLSLDAGQSLELGFTLRPQRVVAAVAYDGGDSLNVRLPITFAAQGAGPPVALTSQSLQILDEIVDLLVNRPSLRRLVIETHWDASVADPLELTAQQARAIGTYLQDQGVAADRLELIPRGATQPVSPTAGKKAPRNRRVVFKVVEG